MKGQLAGVLGRFPPPIEVRGEGRRGTPIVREWAKLYGETQRKHLGIPLFQAEIAGE